MYLSELPSEIILIIAECLESQPTINALAQTSSAFYALLNPFLYRYHVQHRVPAPALEWAAERGHAGTLQKLLKAGADIYCKRPWSLEPRSFYFHPINRAAERGHTRIVEILLDEGMHDRLTDLNYTTILRSAIPTNQIDVVKLLLSRGVNPWYTADGSSTICHTVRHGDAGLVRLLLLDAEQRDSLSPAIIRHEIGRALCVSAGKSEDITRMLLAAGADIDFREKDRVTTALTIASSLKRVSMLKFLLEAGANPNILNSDIWGPLASATLNKCDLRPWDDTRRFDEMMTVARLLFEYGADPARAGGTWALHNAVCTQNYEMACLLIDKDIRLRIPSLDASQQVAMDQAVEERDFDIITRLIPLTTRHTYCRRRIRTRRSK